MADGWATQEDLLVGDTVATHDVREKHMADAYNEIMVQLTQYYATPLPANNTLPEHVLRLLTQVHIRLASGRLLLAMAVSSEDESVHAYGQMLIQEARVDLARLGSQIPIPGATPADNNSGAADNDRQPTVLNVDTASPFDAFADYTSKAGFTIWEPYDA